MPARLYVSFGVLSVASEINYSKSEALLLHFNCWLAYPGQQVNPGIPIFTTYSKPRRSGLLACSIAASKDLFKMRRRSVDTSENRPAQSFLPKALQSPKPNAQTEDGEQSPNETSRLLPKPADDGENSSSNEEGEVYDLEDGDKSTWQLVTREFLLLLRGSIPVILAYTLQNSLQTISVLIVGRASPEDLATAAFSYMFAMCTAWLVALGGSTALDTLASSTYTGSSNKHDLGVLLQRSFIILGLFYVPVVILWLFSEPVFKLLGQDPDLSRDSAKFLTCLIPGGLGYIYFEAMKKYFQAQGKLTSLQSYES